MTELLVSVRSVAEAKAALRGGAGLIDVKEPSRGSLGRATDSTLAAVIGFVANRRPVSAALGELVEDPSIPHAPGLSYVKLGLAGCGGTVDWPQRLEEVAERLKAAPSCRPVAVAYADWRSAKAPPPHKICAFACANHWGAFLLDTCIKDTSTLLDWLPPVEVGHLCTACRNAGVRVALAGSLGESQIIQLRSLSPDWFAVRGSVCRGRKREGTVDPDAVRRLSELVAGGLATTIA